MTSDKAASPVPFAQAVLGDEAYTWELEGWDWGDYKFETVDPQETGAWDDSDSSVVLIRKRWQLVEVTEIHPEPQPDDDEEDEAMFGDVKFIGTFLVGGDDSTPDNTDGSS